MTITARNLAIAAVTSILFSQPLSIARAQGAEKAPAEKKVLTPEEKAEADFQKAIKRGKAAEAFYAATSPLEVTLTLNIKRIRGDKADKAPWRQATFAYTDPTGKQVVIPAEARTRGIWRLKNCEFPPLRLNFKGDATKGTLLQGIDKPKLVNFCKDTDDQEQYLLQEAQLYRIYNLLTPASHRMRVLTVNYTDSASGKLHAKRIGLLLEEPEVMAARNGGPIMELKGALPQDLEPYHDALVGVFQYFIGNTDFSIYALHNIELVMQPSGNFLPVAYDFDFSGAIATNYATPDPKLAIQNVKMRLYRGYCVPAEEYQKVIAKFNEQKAAIYALYTDEIGKLMKPKVVENTLKYYDDFYKTINDPKRVKREIGDDCVKTN
jgi:hypothetical protein